MQKLKLNNDHVKFLKDSSVIRVSIDQNVNNSRS